STLLIVAAPGARFAPLVPRPGYNPAGFLPHSLITCAAAGRLDARELMRVLQLAPIWETVPPPAYGGTEAVIHVLTEELVRRGIDVTLCASGDSTTSADLVSVFPHSLRPAGLTADALQFSLIHVAKSRALAGDSDLV